MASLAGTRGSFDFADDSIQTSNEAQALLPIADIVNTATSFDAVYPSQVEGPSDPWPDSTMLDDDEAGDLDECEPDESEPEECDTFQQLFEKLSEETLPHQTTTKAEAFLLLLSYVVTAGLTWAQLRGCSY